MTALTSLRRSASAGLITLFLASGAVAAGAAPAEAAVVKPCMATVSTASPRQYTDVYVNVSQVGAGSTVTTQAKYKTTTNTKRAKASTKGTASVKYPISGATPGRKVTVDVSATQGGTTWKCATSFTPRKR